MNKNKLSYTWDLVYNEYARYKMGYNILISILLGVFIHLNKHIIELSSIRVFIISLLVFSIPYIRIYLASMDEFITDHYVIKFLNTYNSTNSIFGNLYMELSYLLFIIKFDVKYKFLKEFLLSIPLYLGGILFLNFLNFNLKSLILIIPINILIFKSLHLLVSLNIFIYIKRRIIEDE